MKRSLRKIGRKLRRYVGVTPENEFGRDPFWDMQQFVPSDASPLILDVGGHIGDSIKLFKAAFPLSIIHSFEPNHESFGKLIENTPADDGTVRWNFALGASPGKKTLFQNESTGMSSFLELGEFGWGKIENESLVELRTIDSFVAEQRIARIDILKSDTQGYELEVLKGAEQALRANRVGLIYLELIFSPMYKGLPPVHQLFEYLNARNFELVSIYRIQHQRNVADWADALFVNKRYFLKSDSV